MSWLWVTAPEHVTVVLSTHTISCAWIQNNRAQRGFTLRGFEKRTCNGYIDDQGFNNSTIIGTFIADFLSTYHVKNARISCAFTRPLVTERLTTKPYATPEPRDLIMTHAPHTLWDFYYMYPTDSNEYVFYVCAITQALLLQYKLMAIKYKLSLLTTTSQTAALFYLYRYTYDQAFRMSQFGLDMQQCNNTPEWLFNQDVLHRIITLPDRSAISFPDDGTTILTMCGLAAEALL